MLADLRFGRLVGAIAITVTAFVSTGCGGTIDGHAQPAVDVVPATSSAKPTSKPSKPSKTTTGKPTPTSSRGGRTDFQANVGDCVKLGGTVEDASIEKAACGSREANFKVIGKAKNSEGCVSDRDQAYFETLDGVQTGALCLDIDWVVGGCLDLGGDDPKRIDCTEGGVDPVKVITIKKNTADVNDCPDSADSGFDYPERRMVVCTESL
ncbi:hypothetical protein [Nocardia sp. NPDC058666]|uniref:LppU family putative lipoprotein n=1 Tax=unclassified Nocardia TaxID=2637762 RepID=UPI00365234D5